MQKGARQDDRAAELGGALLWGDEERQWVVFRSETHILEEEQMQQGKPEEPRGVPAFGKATGALEHAGALVFPDLEAHARP